MKEIRRSRRVLAGMLAVAMVFGTAPASLFNGGFLAGTAITASADTQVTLNRNEVYLVEGGFPASIGSNVSVTYESSDKDVVSLSVNPYSGSTLVLPVSEGTATITATATDGSGATATCNVTVRKSCNYLFTYGDKAVLVRGPEAHIPSIIYNLTGQSISSAESVEFSDDTLITALNDYVYPKKAFSSTETMKVTSGGNEYEIKITGTIPEIPQCKKNKYIMYSVSDYGFEVRGRDDNGIIPTTYYCAGYKTQMQVGGNSSITFSNFEYGKQYTSDGVNADITAKLYGKEVYITYTMTNTNNEAKTVKIGSSADTQIGTSDRAPCSFTEDGIKMVDNDNINEFKLIPVGEGFTTRWYGYYDDANDNVFVNRDDTSVFSEDSGIAWSWTVEIPAGETVTRTAKLSAGEVGVSQVIYDPNGGTGDMDPTIEIPEEEIELNANTFVREGYTFKGWDTDSAGETVVYADGASFVMPNEDTILYAVWGRSIKDEPKANDGLTYSGNEQDLISAGTVEDGKLVYAMGDNDENSPESDTYSENIPRFTKAGTYYVWYKVVTDDNQDNTKPVCIVVTIDKADPVFTAPTANELTEDETVQDLITTNDCDGGKMLYALGTDATTTPDEDAFSDEIPTADESGTYYVWYKVVGDENHNDVAPACVPVTVAEADWLVGDVNNDGKINVADVAKAAAHVKGKRLLSKGAFKRADVNFDGTVDVTDVVQIAAHVKLKRMIVQKKDLS